MQLIDIINTLLRIKLIIRTDDETDLVFSLYIHIRVEEYDGILPLLLFHKELTEQDNDLATVCYLCIIYEQEKKAS